MERTYLLGKLFKTYNGIDIITDLIDQILEEQSNNRIEALKATPQITAILDKLTERELSYLEEAAINLEGAAQFLDFKTGIDVAFTLLGLEPVYGILPDDSKAEKKKKLFRGF